MVTIISRDDNGIDVRNKVFLLFGGATGSSSGTHEEGYQAHPAIP